MPRRARQGLPTTWHVAAIEHAADAILVADLDGTVQYVNAAFERDSGLGRDTVLGSHLRRFAAPKRTTISTKAVRDAIRRGEPSSGDLVSRRADGTLGAIAQAARHRDGRRGRQRRGAVKPTSPRANRVLPSHVPRARIGRTVNASPGTCVLGGQTSRQPICQPGPR